MSAAPFPPVLVVDDVPLMVSIMTKMLETLGFREISTASDGAEALSKLHQRSHGLVISDWAMHPMTGYELLRHVRSDNSLKKIPFILTTTQSNSDMFPMARQAGVNGCIIKPFTLDVLRKSIIAACGSGRPNTSSQSFL